jgi:hypothetical protein
VALENVGKPSEVPVEISTEADRLMTLIRQNAGLTRRALSVFPLFSNSQA